MPVGQTAPASTAIAPPEQTMGSATRGPRTSNACPTSYVVPTNFAVPPDAVRLLKRRLAEIGRGRLVGPSIERTTFEELAALVMDDYEVNGRRSLRRAEQSLAHLRAHFGLTLVADIHEGRVRGYVRARLEQGAANATINRELAALKRAFTPGGNRPESRPRAAHRAAQGARAAEGFLRAGAARRAAA